MDARAREVCRDPGGPVFRDELIHVVDVVGAAILPDVQGMCLCGGWWIVHDVIKK